MSVVVVVDVVGADVVGVGAPVVVVGVEGVRGVVVPTFVAGDGASGVVGPCPGRPEGKLFDKLRFWKRVELWEN